MMSLSIALLFTAACDSSQPVAVPAAPVGSEDSTGGSVEGSTGSSSSEGGGSGDSTSSEADDAPRLDLPADDGVDLGTTTADVEPPPVDVTDLRGCEGDECLPCGKWSLSWQPVEGATNYAVRWTSDEAIGSGATRFTADGAPSTLAFTMKDGRVTVDCGLEGWQKCQDYYRILELDVQACFGLDDCTARVPLAADQLPEWVDFGVCPGIPAPKEDTDPPEEIPPLDPGEVPPPVYVAGSTSAECLPAWGVSWTEVPGATHYRARWQCNAAKGQPEHVVDLGTALETNLCTLGLCEWECMGFDEPIDFVRIEACDANGCSDPGRKVPRPELPGYCINGLCC